MNPLESRPFLRKVRGLVVQRSAELCCTFALLVMAVNLFAVISQKSLTNDEKYHIPAGYYHLAFGDFHLNPEHPPLIKMVAAVPLLFLRPAAPSPTLNPNENPVLQGHDAFQAFWDANPEKFESIAFWARVPMIALTLLFGIVLFAYTRYLAGGLAAALAVLMFSFEPTILAHGRIVQTDAPAAFAYLLFFFTWQRLIDRSSLRRACEFGLAAGFALVVKFSLLVILPVFVASLIVLGWRQYSSDHRWHDLGLKLGAAVLAVLLLVNLAYYFNRQPLLPANRDLVAQEWPSAVSAFDVLSKIVPSTYLFGIFVLKIHNDWGHNASLLGDYSRTGWWYYFPVAYALKTSVPFLLISLVSWIWAGWRLLRHRETMLFLPLFALALYLTICVNSRINIGVRHFLPMFPFFFLLSGIFLSRMLQSKHKRIATAVAVVLCSWMAIEAIRAFPNYVPYMNQFAFSQPHWRYLSDSNVEWGDDTGELARYLRARGETKVRAALLGGWMSRTQYGVDYVNVLVVDQPVEQTRYIALGASFLNGSTVPLIRNQRGEPITEQQRHDFFTAYRDRIPEAVFGNSIYLFRERD
jgi:4-amino-4-deoxy-L-arabinose transferase-like glycosyltransferase